MNKKIEFRHLLELMGLMIAGVLLGGFITNALLGELNESLSAEQPVMFLLFIALSLTFSFGLPALIWLKLRGNLTDWNVSHIFNLRFFFIAFLLFLAMIFVSEGIFSILSELFESRGWSDLTEEAYNVQAVRDVLRNKNLLPLTILVIAILPAVFEELFFRKVIFGYLFSRTHSFWVPAILSSLFFAGLHNHILSFVPIFLLGLALTYAFYVTGKVWVAMLFHALNNLFSILLIYVGVDQNSHIHWVITLACSLLVAFIFINHLPKLEKPPEIIEED